MRLQGSEHKPVQSHCSRSLLANGRAITLLYSCCVPRTDLLPLCSPSLGISNPFPQHTGTRFCLPQLQNLTTAKHWQRTCTAQEVGPHLFNSSTQLTLLHTAFNKPNPRSFYHLQSTGTLNPLLHISPYSITFCLPRISPPFSLPALRCLQRMVRLGKDTAEAAATWLQRWQNTWGPPAICSYHTAITALILLWLMLILLHLVLRDASAAPFRRHRQSRKVNQGSINK